MHSACPYVELPTCLYLPPPMGMRVAGLSHLISNPSVGIPDRVWPLSSQPCPGLQVGLTGGSSCQNLGPAPPAWTRPALGFLGGCGWPGSQTRTILSLRSHPISQEVGEVCKQVQFSTQLLIHLNWTCFLSFSSFHGEASDHHAMSFESWDLGCNLRLSMEQLSHSSGQDCRGLEERDWCQLECEGERALLPPQPTASLIMGSFSYRTGTVCPVVLPQGLDLPLPNLGNTSSS